MSGSPSRPVGERKPGPRRPAVRGAVSRTRSSKRAPGPHRKLVHPAAPNGSLGWPSTATISRLFAPAMAASGRRRAGLRGRSRVAGSQARAGPGRRAAAARRRRWRARGFRAGRPPRMTSGIGKVVLDLSPCRRGSSRSATWQKSSSTSELSRLRRPRSGRRRPRPCWPASVEPPQCRPGAKPASGGGDQDVES